MLKGRGSINRTARGHRGKGERYRNIMAENEPLDSGSASDGVDDENDDDDHDDCNKDCKDDVSSDDD